MESIKIFCNATFLKEKDVLEVILKYSQKNFYELKFYDNDIELELFSKELESFFASWRDCKPRKSLSFIIVGSNLKVEEENMEVIKKYVELGIIKKFNIVKE